MAARILGHDHVERHAALQSVKVLDPADVGPTLRAALFTALEREAQLDAARYAADLHGEPLEDHPDPEFASRLTEVIVALHDPAAIPALAASLATGSTASMWGLAQFGEEAAPALLEVVKSADSQPRQVDWALISLRMMIENMAVRPLSTGVLEQIRWVAEERLNEAQEGIGSTLLWAIDLAVVLEDSDLRKIVQRLASDPRELMARGVIEPGLIERAQKHAADRLAGLPPRPRFPGALH